MPLTGNVSQNISELTHHGTRPRSRKQIIAIAIHAAAKKGKFSKALEAYAKKKANSKEQTQPVKTPPIQDEPLQLSLRTLIARAAERVHPSPSDKQRKAGNYRMGHISLHGMDITIESPAGSVRKGKDKKGKAWETTMQHHYGYVKRTESEADGDHVDVFVGPHPESELVFVIDQNDASGKFDEHKCMVGFTNAEKAKEAYHANYSKGWNGFAHMRSLTVDQFKKWVKRGNTHLPIARQVLTFNAEPIKLDRPLPGWVPQEDPDHPKPENTGWVPVQSSWIAGVKMTPDRVTHMTVKKGGKSYDYPGINLEQFKRWIKARSPGKWWWRNIGYPMKDAFPHQLAMDQSGQFRPVTPAEFIQARSRSARPQFLSPHTADELTGKNLFLSPDGTAGYMLDEQGDFGNVFNNGGPPGAGRRAIQHAVENGAKTLDCFDGFLPHLYASHGYVATGAVKFNDEYAPPGWDYAKYGRPDIIFMRHTGEVKPHAHPGKYFDSWDDAKAHSRGEGVVTADHPGEGRTVGGDPLQAAYGSTGIRSQSLGPLQLSVFTGKVHPIFQAGNIDHPPQFEEFNQYTPAEIMDWMRRHVHPQITPAHLSAMIGWIPGAKTFVHREGPIGYGHQLAGTEPTNLTFSTSAPGIDIMRTIHSKNVMPSGQAHIHNEHVAVPDYIEDQKGNHFKNPYRGITAPILLRQMRAAYEMGIPKIDWHAAWSTPEQRSMDQRFDYTGGLHWPFIGAEGFVPSFHRIPDQIRQAADAASGGNFSQSWLFSDFFKSPEAKQWYSENPGGHQSWVETTPGSYSRTAIERHVGENAARHGMEGPIPDAHMLQQPLPRNAAESKMAEPEEEETQPRMTAGQRLEKMKFSLNAFLHQRPRYHDGIEHLLMTGSCHPEHFDKYFNK